MSAKRHEAFMRARQALDAGLILHADVEGGQYTAGPVRRSPLLSKPEPFAIFGYGAGAYFDEFPFESSEALARSLVFGRGYAGLWGKNATHEAATRALQKAGIEPWTAACPTSAPSVAPTSAPSISVSVNNEIPAGPVLRCMPQAGFVCLDAGAGTAEIVDASAEGGP
jgi:hypothetical protein